MAGRRAQLRIGIDTGGTFTDIVCVDGAPMLWIELGEVGGHRDGESPGSAPPANHVSRFVPTTSMIPKSGYRFSEKIMLKEESRTG